MCEPLDLAEVRATWLVQCGPCDFGLVEYGCNCPPGDYRPVLLRAVEELEQARAELDRYRKAINAARLLFPDRAAAGGGTGSPATEHQPSPTPTGCGRPGCRESEGGYELVASTEPCPQCREVDRA